MLISIQILSWITAPFVATTSWISVRRAAQAHLQWFMIKQASTVKQTKCPPPAMSARRHGVFATCLKPNIHIIIAEPTFAACIPLSLHIALAENSQRLSTGQPRVGVAEVSRALGMQDLFANQRTRYGR